jgi:hypothetical protein
MNEAAEGELTLTTSPWTLLYIVVLWLAVVDLVRLALAPLWIAMGTVGTLVFALIYSYRWTVFVRSGVVFRAGWSPTLGSWMSSGLDLSRLRSVELHPALLPFQALVLTDDAGDKLAIPRFLPVLRNFGALARLVAQSSLSDASTVEMSEETQRRLIRFAA